MRTTATLALFAGACASTPPPAPSSNAATAHESATASRKAPEARGLLASICREEMYRAPNLAAAKVNQVASGFSFIEGPVWLAEGALLFSDMQPSAGPENVQPSHIRRFTPGSDAAPVFIENAGSNGLALGADGRVYACTHDQRSVSVFDVGTKTRKVVVERSAGKRFNSPNDLVLHENGSIYFTDPGFQRGNRESETGITGIYRLAKDGSVTLVDGTRTNPNGITLSPDETLLYVNAGDNQVLRYAVREDGSTGPAEPFSSVPVPMPDGMTVDCAGNVYATAHSEGRLIVLDPDGREVGSVTIAPKLTNVAFGGPERRTLYATTGNALYAVELDVPGRPY